MNNIIIELSAEDRARLDRLTEALERRAQQEAPVIVTAADPVKEKLAEVMAKAAEPTEAPKNAPETTEAPTLTTTPPTEEKATAEETAPTEEAKPTVTTEQIRQKVILLSAVGGQKKAKAREIVSAYAPKISDLPEDKLTEVWDKLTALEQEA